MSLSNGSVAVKFIRRTAPQGSLVCPDLRACLYCPHVQGLQGVARGLEEVVLRHSQKTPLQALLPEVGHMDSIFQRAKV
jgi:hypothetical protein